MATKIRIRRDTIANFTANNIILADGEIAVARDSNGADPTHKYLYVGDGVKTIVQLGTEAFRSSRWNNANYLAIGTYNADKSNFVTQGNLQGQLNALRGDELEYNGETIVYMVSLINALTARIDALENGGMTLAEVDGGAAVEA